MKQNFYFLKPIFLLFSLLILSKGQSQEILFGNFFGDNSNELNGNYSLNVPVRLTTVLSGDIEEGFSLFISPGYLHSRIVLEKNQRSWIFNSNSEGKTTYVLDDNPDHEYKRLRDPLITYGALELSIGTYYRINKFSLLASYSPHYILAGKFKRTYFVAEDKTIIKDKFKENESFHNINRLQHKFYLGAFYKNVGIYGYLNLTSFFKESTNIHLKSFGVGISSDLYVFRPVINLPDF